MTMDHAEAHERIADLALDPGELDRLARSEALGPAERAFLGHVRGCPACTADLAAARQLDRGLRFALGEASGDGDAARDAVAAGPISPPDWLRGAVLGAAHADAGRTVPRPAVSRADAFGSPARRRGWPLALPRLSAPQWAGALALALLVALVGGLAGRATLPTGQPGSDAPLVAAVATLDRVLAAPDHHVATLQAAGGNPSGSVAWTARDFVVLTSALASPASGQVYRCWLEWSGRWAAVGSMDFAGSTAYWSGATGDWARLMAEPGTRFVVTAEAAAGSADAPTGAVLLAATLGS